ncbi:Gfo/Idh/MocA family oxidoreductase [Nocardioides aestuarii]|uniref:Gfo/Idh/MocA family protein n=1 Tax=Nocardioides aestuarii TaxID=252231 RepID=A0ABW4TLN1_9ACTN
MSTEPVPTRWGILATGRIAGSFVTDLRDVPGASVAAVGSRSAGGAERFVAEHGLDGARTHASYADLVADPDVDVVYVASPHALHLEHALLALAAGKHVLCEKPLVMNVAEAEQLVAAAREADRFLMEAMWTACHPVVRAVVSGLEEGRFGIPRQVHASLGFRVEGTPDDRMFDPALGAGALLDMGIYPLTLADLTLGPVEQAVAVADVDDRGVDQDVSVATRHAGGGLGALTASMTSASPRTAHVATDTGRLDFPDSFHHPTHVTWTPTGGEPERIEGLEPVLGSGLGNEALHVAHCLRGGLRESPLVPHAMSLRLAAVMDDVRRQVGVTYAADGR